VPQAFVCWSKNLHEACHERRCIIDLRFPSLDVEPCPHEILSKYQEFMYVFEKKNAEALFKHQPCHVESIEYVVMPFGFTNMPSIFQHIMNDVFCGYLDDFMVCYIHESLIFSKNMEDHECHVCLVFEMFERLDFMPSLRNENSINLKQNCWVTSYLEMAFACMLIKFKALLIMLF